MTSEFLRETKIEILNRLGYVHLPMTIKIITTGGTIDKVYFDAKSQFEVGEPQIKEILREAHVTFDFDVVPLFQKDSLELTDADRQVIKTAIQNESGDKIIVTHGTDTMIETAKVLKEITGKTIVLTGSLSPARFRNTDAVFNIGCAVAAVQSLPQGVYITMNGQVFDPAKTRKNRDKNRFEAV